MFSGPYQSNVLRFVLSQYRNGVGRHRRAVRTTQTAIRQQAQLGLSIAIWPVGAVLKSLKFSQQLLSQSLQRSDTFLQAYSRRSLFDWSGFSSGLQLANRDLHTELTDAAEVSTRSVLDVVNNRLLRGLSRAVPGFIKTEVRPTESDGSSALARSSSLRAERSLFETMRLVANLLTSSQTGHLKETCNSSPKLVRSLNQALGWMRRSTASRGALFGASVGLESRFAQPIGRKAVAKSARITGIASDIETRSLVLVISNVQIWSGLSPSQQVTLKEQIAFYLSRAANEQAIGERSYPLSARNRLAGGKNPLFWALKLSQTVTQRLIHSLIELKGLWQQDKWERQNAFVALGLLIQAPFLWMRSPIQSRVVQDLQAQNISRLPEKLPLLLTAFESALGTSSSVLHCAMGMTEMMPRQSFIQTAEPAQTRDDVTLRSEVAQAVGVIDVSGVTLHYIEHPFEKVLKWIDRVLLWIERLLSKVKSFVTRLLANE